ncbi:hypothetical protein ACA910_009636 [Epithemia clementina (nom. ined.)]
MVFKLDLLAGLEVYVDANFAGNRDPVEAITDRDTAQSRHGYIIKFLGCPIVWKSQLQLEIAWSSKESKYTRLLYALRSAIPLMGLLKEIKDKGFTIAMTEAEVHCKVFEDNWGIGNGMHP